MKTLAEKLLSQHSGEDVRAGDILLVTPDAVMAHDGRLGQLMSLYAELGAPRTFEGEVVFVLDHYAPPPTAQLAGLHRDIREFAARVGARVYDVGEGICHNLMTERGHVAPGRVVVGTDSHCTTYGALNAFGVGVESSDVVALLATKKVWFRVPETIRVELTGALPQGVTTKDVTLWLLARIGEDGAAYCAFEFCGSGWRALEMDARFTLSNHCAELGAKAALQPFDERTRTWLGARGIVDYRPVAVDDGAVYVETLRCDLSTLQPQVAIEHHIDRVVPVMERAHTRVDVAFIGSCTNGRLQDLRDAVSALGGKRVAAGTRLLVNPGSKEVYLAALREGLITALIEAGATVLPPGCGSCVAMNRQYVPADGEVVVSSANRNFQGRLGNKNAEVYVASPATVAASAAAGHLATGAAT